MLPNAKSSRRQFIAAAALVGARASLSPWSLSAAAASGEGADLAVLPHGPNPAPVPLPHFPDRLHTFIWRNWGLVATDRLATVLGTNRSNVSEIAASMGLPPKPRINGDQQRRSYITIIKRNWHLLGYEQLLVLLGWNAEQLAFTLREDDFLFVKLGSLKPNCHLLRFKPPDAAAQARARQIAATVEKELGGLREAPEPLFAFVKDLGQSPQKRPRRNQSNSLRYCYSYFALYGDPLLNSAADPYPDGYLERLAALGVTGVWLQGLLAKLAPFPWRSTPDKNVEIRLANLRKLVARGRRHGIGVYLYLNEPRSLPLGFFMEHPELRGAVEGEHAALCMSHPDVRAYLAKSAETICRAAPDLAGFFTITASENFTNCWSHGGGANCPRCRARSPGDVIAGVNAAFMDGILAAGVQTRLLAWDWGWAESWSAEAIKRLPKDVALQSVSEWDLPIERGGISSAVGEYSISSIGPGPRAKRHWALAKEHGLKTVAKIQAGNTWELSAVPYIPALRNVAQHAVNLRKEGIDGIMLGWTLGGYPSPNLEIVDVVEELGRKLDVNISSTELVDRSLQTVAERRFGPDAGPHIVTAWNSYSRAFSQFPYNIGVVYSAPLQLGPANLLWPEPTNYHATMVGFPYDDLDTWRAIYPPEVFAVQLERVANGFQTALKQLIDATDPMHLPKSAKTTLAGELRVAEAAAIHFQSVANQTRFVMARRTLRSAKDPASTHAAITRLQQLLESELTLARRLYELQTHDSRIGFEASNQYYYVPIDLAEKILNCRDLLDRWLPAERAQHGLPAPTRR